MAYNLNILLMNNSSDYDHLNKNLSLDPNNVTSDKIIRAYIRDSIDIINPVIKIFVDDNGGDSDGSNNNFNILLGAPIFNFNYCYIYNFKRYYFIDNYIFNDNNVILQLSEDYLTTWKTAILNVKGVCERCESQSLKDPYLLDNIMAQQYPKKLINKSKLTNSNIGNVSANSNVYYLMTVGGVS